MRRKTPNEKVLRAISIGLAAMIAIQPVMATPVFADDTDPSDDTDNKKYDEAEKESSTANSAREAVDEAKEPITTIINEVITTNEEQSSSSDRVDSVIAETANEISKELTAVSDELSTVDVELTIAEANKAILDTYEDLSDADPEAVAANTAVEKAEAAVNTENAANDNIDAAVEKGNKAAENVVAQYSDGVSAVSDADDAVTQAEENFANLVNSITNATSISDATKAYEDLGTMLSETQVSVDEKQEALDAAKGKLAEFIDEYENARKAAEEARAAFVAAESDYEEASTDYKNATDSHKTKENSVNEFNDAYIIAQQNLKAAEDRLETITKKAEKLSKAINDAKVAVENSAALDVVAKINAVDDLVERLNAGEKEKDINFWGGMNDLFNSIMMNYYIPEVLHATDYELHWNNDKTDPVYKTLDKTYSDGDYNYCVVTYKDENGKTVTRYFNYKRETGSKSNIVIFEKRDVEVEANRVLNANKGKELYEIDGIEVEGYSVDNKKYDTLEALKQTEKNIQQIGTVLYKVKTLKSTTPQELNIEKDENGAITSINGKEIVNDITTKTEVQIGDETPRASYEVESGKVVLKYETEVTTVSYNLDSSLSENSKNDDGDYKYLSEAEATAALEKISEGKDVKESGLVSFDRKIDTEIATKTYQASYTYDVIDEKNILSIDISKENEINELRNNELLKELKKNDNGPHDFVEKLKKLSPEEYKELGFSYLSIENGALKYILDNQKTETVTAEVMGKQVLNSDGSVNVEETEKAYEAAKTQAEAELKNKLKDKGINDAEITAVFLKDGTDTASYTKTTWGFNLSYWKKESEQVDTYVTKTETYNSSKVKGEIQQNKNYNDNPLLTESTDENFQKFINEAIVLKNKYENLAVEAAKEEEAIEKTQKEIYELNTIVENLRGQIPESPDWITINDLPENGKISQKALVSIIEELKKAGVDFGDKDIKDISIEDIKTILEAEQIKLNAIKDRLNALNYSMDDVAEELAATIERLTPTAEISSETETDEESISTPTASVIGTPTVVTPIASIPTSISATPSAGVAGARIARGDNSGILEESGDTIELGEELEGELPVAEQDDKHDELKNKEVKTIKDEEIPLAAFPEDSAKKMNWWWLLLIALLGTTGEEMYRRHKKKKEEQAALEAEINNK